MPTDILTFWFQYTAPKQWWQVDPAFDTLIATRFGALLQQAAFRKQIFNMFVARFRQGDAALLFIEIIICFLQQRDQAINAVIERGAVFLAVCAGFQILGNSFYADGKEHRGLGLLNVDSIPGDKRYVGDIKVKYLGMDLELTGFENHAGKTILGNGAQPFSKVESGFGNGDGKFDGAMNGNIFGTYLHGPILARNPEFADLLLNRAIGHKFTTFNDPVATKYATWRRKVTK